MTEAQLLAAVIDLARLYAWRCLHIRPAMSRHGWRTPLQGDGVGWPDLLLIRAERVLAVELKSDRGSLTPDQAAWLDVLYTAGVETALWRRRDWQSGHILAALQHDGARQSNVGGTHDQ